MTSLTPDRDAARGAEGADGRVNPRRHTAAELMAMSEEDFAAQGLGVHLAEESDVSQTAIPTSVLHRHTPDSLAAGEDRTAAEITKIENTLAEIEGTMRLLLSLRIVQDGHAKNLRAAAKIVRDPARLAELYPEMRA